MLKTLSRLNKLNLLFKLELFNDEQFCVMHIKYSHTRPYSMIPAYLHHWWSLIMFYICYTYTLSPEFLASGVQVTSIGQRREGGRRLRESEGWMTHPLALFTLAINPVLATAETSYQSGPSNSRDKPVLTLGRPVYLLHVTWLSTFLSTFSLNMFRKLTRAKFLKELREEKKRQPHFYHLTQRIKHERWQIYSKIINLLWVKFERFLLTGTVIFIYTLTCFENNNKYN